MAGAFFNAFLYYVGEFAFIAIVVEGVVRVEERGRGIEKGWNQNLLGWGG